MIALNDEQAITVPCFPSCVLMNEIYSLAEVKDALI